ncbi:general substrate transporter [Sistotremastrum suecicum HHB10207 ss-3]|uniref:General substrate transporter n=1 Tax=Sistotremastrum suecicum HHB10207 ss-3 TaxID=1314776 RepID=A0A165YH34_9AGAM|nr:general substrate transporter [Sistotremastrum suecicum HHB10207 ss-3]
MLDHAVHSRIPTPGTPLERQNALAVALQQDPGIKHGSRRAWHMYFIVLCACLCSTDNGFDGTVMGGINSMHQYQSYFGMTGAGLGTSLVFGIYTVWVFIHIARLQALSLTDLSQWIIDVGALCCCSLTLYMPRHRGTIPASILPDRYGRRLSMFAGNLILIIGALITGTATFRSTFIFGRFLTGVGGACAAAAAQSYLAEMAPAHDRGLYLGILNSFYYVGQISATGMMVSTGKYENDWSWRLPLFVQLIPALFNAIFIFSCPESPRWLYANGRCIEARQVLAKLHSSTGDLYSPLVDLEMEEIEDKVTVDDEGDEASQPLLNSGNSARRSSRSSSETALVPFQHRILSRVERFWDFGSLFADTPGTRYRTWMVILIGVFGQLSGNGMVTYFLPNLLVIAGITNQNTKLILNFVNSITSFLGALSGSALVDRIGRRSILIWSTAGLVVLLSTASGLLSNPSTSPARGSAGIAFIYIFMVVFSFGWTPMQSLYPSEVLPYQNRAKGLAFSNVIAQGSSCVNTFGLPLALELLNWRVILIFVFWDTFEAIILYLFMVETKGLSLEEIDETLQYRNWTEY